MKTVAVGLTEKEAFALSLLLRKLQPEGAFVAQSLGAATQGGDLYVIDADAWVREHGVEQATAHLRGLLQGRPAVLLMAPHVPDSTEQAQADAQKAAWTAQGWVVLRRPFRAEAMRQALDAAAAHAASAPADPIAKPDDGGRTAAQAQAHSDAPATAPLPFDTTASQRSRTSAFFSSAFFATTVQGPASQPAPAGGAGFPPPEITNAQLSLGEFTASLATSPSAECRHFLGALAQRLAQPGPFEMSFTMINGLVFDANQGWVASNTPMSVLRMVARSRSLGAHVKIVDLDADAEARRRAEQRGMTAYPLGGHAACAGARGRLPAARGGQLAAAGGAAGFSCQGSKACPAMRAC